ncbi:MAG: hypothetical protein HW386_995 [Gammaproteobacteria bacterium]|nr:hypothetical protein [Gammaproteobacteria bacterium]
MIFRWLAGLFRPSGSADPPLVPVTRRITGKTIEETLHRFEDRYSEENFQNVAVQENTEHTDGTLVRYEVRWKYSVFDDGPYSNHISWALLIPADPGAGDPADARYRVAAATADHHMGEMQLPEPP